MTRRWYVDSVGEVNLEGYSQGRGAQLRATRCRVLKRSDDSFESSLALQRPSAIVSPSHEVYKLATPQHAT